MAIRYLSYMDYNEELEFAKAVSKQAGKIMLHYQGVDPETEIKQDGTPVTIADTAINSMIIEQVKERFPDDEIVGEEESTAGYGGGRRWICDPIDGTAGFVVGVPSATFSLALVFDGQPKVAVIYEPTQDKLFYAVKDRGSFCNNSRINVSKQTFKDGIIALAPDYVTSELIDLPFMKKLLSYNKQLAIFPGAAYRSCMIANGRIAGFPHPQVKPYDIAAAHLIVEEAGGKVSGMDGGELDYSNEFKGAIISNGACHQALLELFNT